MGRVEARVDGAGLSTACRAVKAGPEARRWGSLDGPVVGREQNGVEKPATASLDAVGSCRGYLLSWVSCRGVRASLLISALDVSGGVGCKMAFGVSRERVR